MNFKTTAMSDRKCRKRFIFYTILYYLNYTGLSAPLPILGYTILDLIPAVAYGCTPAPEIQDDAKEETVLRLMKSSGDLMSSAGSADILIFNDDRMQRLDAYQESAIPSCSVIKAASTAGNKIMAVFVNAQRERYDWAEINSFEGLEDICVNLEQEASGQEAMSGVHRGRAGSPANISLERLASEVVIRSISCSFKGKAYDGMPLKNAKAYLTNVNAEAPLITQHPYIPRRIVNSGKLDMDDVSGFSEPDMIFHEFGSDITGSRIWPDVRFRCYPNETPEEYPGAPFTRLVIEGEIDGKTYYWPFNINRDGTGKGIERNCRYIYDIKITRLGHTSPDIPIETDNADITSEIETWKDKEEYGVRF